MFLIEHSRWSKTLKSISIVFEVIFLFTSRNITLTIKITGKCQIKNAIKKIFDSVDIFSTILCLLYLHFETFYNEVNWTFLPLLSPGMTVIIITCY